MKTYYIYTIKCRISDLNIMNYCSSYGCNENQVKGSQLKFHKFPLNDPELKWHVVMKREDFVGTEHSRFLCDPHSKPCEFLFNKTKAWRSAFTYRFSISLKTNNNQEEQKEMRLDLKLKEINQEVKTVTADELSTPISGPSPKTLTKRRKSTCKEELKIII